VIDLQRAIPNANEREDDEALEVLRAERDEEDEWPEVDDMRGAELDPAVFATIERDLATVRDGEDRREFDERIARFLADGPPGCPPGNDLDESSD
jgi:hypothetical protein